MYEMCKRRVQTIEIAENELWKKYINALEKL